VPTVSQDSVYLFFFFLDGVSVDDWETRFGLLVEGMPFGGGIRVLFVDYYTWLR
jgi:hypothetical protein